MPELATAPPSALEPLFGPSDPPILHRTRSKDTGKAEVVKGRRPSPIPVVQSLRQEVSEWRDGQYGGASDTSRALLKHWFAQEHELIGGDGISRPFSYYFCQREAIETLVYLYEVRGVRKLSGLIADFAGSGSERSALGISPGEDAWARYAFKVATGAGKTKIMSLAIAWSYFHAIYETDSPMAKDFVLIAPGVTVFERLKEDFRPEGGGPDIFESDPVVPPAWRSDWNLSVVLQDEASAAVTGGTLYLTNIHRLYDTSKRRKREAEAYDFMGPAVAKSTAYDSSKELRERITSHARLMVLNDEAHHVWDPGSAWSEAVTFLHKETERKGGGLVAQLDLSATPKDNRGEVFRHVVVDTPLGEAVDAGIVKSPIIGKGELVERAHDDAAYKYENHLTLGYLRWKSSHGEWSASGKKPLLFVMTENTAAADQIAHRLNSDPTFADLNGKTINLHTNLKGSLKKRGRGAAAYEEFVESEKDISDDDLRALRKLSRELDSDSSPYRCIVSVLMLREGWDVRNVTTIVPLRPLTAQSKILPEQTLGRGLRRMTPPGPDAPAETVTVVEHPSFAALYEEQLSAEGVPLEAVDVDDVPRMTVSIYPDLANKNMESLDLLIPQLSHGYRVDSDIEGLSFDDVREGFRPLGPLPLGEPRDAEIEYEGRHLITNELVEQMRIKLPLLEDGMGAISFYREMIERACRIRGTHTDLAPLIQRFLEELLFGEKVGLYDQRVIVRLADSDVVEYIRAVFVPLVLEKIVRTQERMAEATPRSVTAWLPFQATHSEKHPAEVATNTPFNLVPCNRSLEVAMAHFLDRSKDVTTFAKNAGPQALRIDSLTAEGHRSLHTPDFLIRKSDGHYLLAETKGRVDLDVAVKARAAIEWCKAASTKKCRWEYLYVPQGVFEGFSGSEVDALARTCKPALVNLLKEANSAQLALPFDLDQDQLDSQVGEFIAEDELASLRAAERHAVRHAVQLFNFMAKKPDAVFAPVFQPLLGSVDRAAETLMLQRLEPSVPADKTDQEVFFSPDLVGAKKKQHSFLTERGRTLKRLLVHRSPIMPTGLLLFCMDYAKKDEASVGGVFAEVRSTFTDLAGSDLEQFLKEQYEFRNLYVAHEKHEPLTSVDATRKALKIWINALMALSAATTATPVTDS
jgi:type III restriction enzyme